MAGIRRSARPVLITPDLYAATDGRGLYRSIDQGASWMSAGLRDQHVCRIAVSPRNPLSMYAAVPALQGRMTGRPGISRTKKPDRDRGVWWRRVRRMCRRNQVTTPAPPSTCMARAHIDTPKVDARKLLELRSIDQWHS